MKFQNYLQVLLAQVDVQINGTRPWDPQVHNRKFYRKILLLGSLGLGESYVDGWWECSQLDEFFTRILRGDLQKKVATNNLLSQWELIRARILNLQSLSRSFQVAREHYDLGNDLYQKMLDARLTYSCGYWKNANTLDEAQEAKLELICRKLKLQTGMTLLDIGCGWGSLMKYAVQNYGVSCVGLTVSQEQIKLGKQLCQGLPIKFLLQDYRQIQGQFDRIASVGMFEHVGYKNYPIFMEVVNRCLKENGLFLLHTMGNSYSTTSGELWLNKYIFPNGMIPSLAQIAKAAEHLLVIEDLHNFGLDYVLTLKAWLNNFEQNWQQLEPIYGKKFYRIWKYYLSSFSGAFASRFIHLWQIIFSKQGLIGRYEAVR